MNEIIKTKFGNAKIDNKGYYVITSTKEGNNAKRLHRLVFEDFYGKIPDGCHIHHKDGNPLNNCIMNLQLLTKREHHSLHNKGENHPMYGKHRLEVTCKKISETKNITGYYRVTKEKTKRCKQGFAWCYQYYENGKRKKIRRVNLDDLEKEVKKRGQPWHKIEEI